MEILNIIVSNIVAMCHNIAFRLCKGKMDKDMEKYKISYASVFKEKGEIYEKLMPMIRELHDRLTKGVYAGISRENSKEIKAKLNAFLDFYSNNRHFLPESLVDKLKKIGREYQQCFEDIYVGQAMQKDQDTITEGALRENQSRNKLMTGYFKPMQEEIVSEMRNDLQIESIRNSRKRKRSNP
jgi:hypothetical protein